ncbi:hypothetical protein CRG98_017999 [Punica granatum]|uniref:Uncharacterized protein n=1 Tax=Punica granatum TaxID=22663 RepID=A0A2I0JZ64_PUNGR|nr:hypothetical protein CRG98_017999 [Punica granatum]
MCSRRECPPFRQCVMDIRENVSPLPVYDPKVEGRWLKALDPKCNASYGSGSTRMDRHEQKKKGNNAMWATLACSRCRPILLIIHGYARTPKKPKNRSICSEVI